MLAAHAQLGARQQQPKHAHDLRHRRQYGPVGAGVLISGGRFDTVADNDIHDNGAWGVLLVPYVDTEDPAAESPTARAASACQALSFCYYDDWGNEIENNTLSHNGFFGNPSNVDLAEISNLAFPGNCWHGNVDTSGSAVSPKLFQGGRPRVTSDPLFIQYFPHHLLRNPGRGPRDYQHPQSARSPATPSFLGNARGPWSTNYPRQTAVRGRCRCPRSRACPVRASTCQAIRGAPPTRPTHPRIQCRGQALCDVVLDERQRAASRRSPPKLSKKPRVICTSTQPTAHSMDFCSKLLADNGVAIAPGIDFDPHHGGSFVRLSFAGPTSDIEEALRRMGAWLNG